MDDLNIIDQFTAVFVSYIDSGFGLLGPDIAFLTTTLIVIDITLAGLFWAMADDKSVIPAFIKKVLYVGAFAFIISNFALLANIVFESFSGLGLRATGSPIAADDLMRPGFVAAAGFEAAQPLLEEVGELSGPLGFFENFVTIAVLMLAWVVVLLAFFILAIQLFISILEFKLTTLAGFVLVPFALWGKTAFLAERVLGNVVASGVKFMVLAIIVGIGSTLFSAFADSFTGDEITLEQAAATVLGALALFMLGIFGPGIASGLISGAPQLGAGAVAGSAAGLALGGAAAGGLAVAGARTGLGAVSAASRGAASLAGGARSSFALARAASGRSGAAGQMAGMAGMAKAAAGAPGTAIKSMAERATAGFREAYSSGARGALGATGGGVTGVGGPGAGVGAAASRAGAPDWASRLRRDQQVRDGVGVAAHTLRDGDRPASGDAPRLQQED